MDKGLASTQTKQGIHPLTIKAKPPS